MPQTRFDADCAEFDLPPRGDVNLNLAPFDIGDNTRAVIAFTDATRHSPDRWFADQLLAALPLPPEQITFLCAVGMHRPSTREEKIAKLGAEIVEQYRVIDHDPAGVVQIGEIGGIPVEVNPEIVAPGTFLLVTGVVEPHQYAGYSGGAKTAVIGCGGPRTIATTHGPTLLDREGIRLGSVDGNPFQDFVRRAGVMIGVDVVANAILPEPDHLVAAAVGGVEVHDDLVKHARQIYETPVPNAPYDVVVAGVGAPKDANLYQASRAATYIGLSGAPVIRPGGVVIVPAAMPEGAGDGVGEQNFHAVLKERGPGPELIRHLREVGCRPGEQRAYMMAQLLQKLHCIFVGADDPEVVTSANLMHAPDIESALKQAADLIGNGTPNTLVVPHALKCIPTSAS